MGTLGVQSAANIIALRQLFNASVARCQFARVNPVCCQDIMIVKKQFYDILDYQIIIERGCFP
jgi:hypothetical protein